MVSGWEDEELDDADFGTDGRQDSPRRGGEKNRENEEPPSLQNSVFFSAASTPP
jgi:hypothetical protein